MDRDNLLTVIEVHADKLLEQCHYVRQNNYDLNTLATLKAVLFDAVEILKNVEDNLE